MVSITSDAMPRMTVGLMYTPPPSFDQVYPSRGDPLTLKYREEGKMRADAATHDDNRVELSAPLSLDKTRKAVKIADRKPEWVPWRNRKSYQARRDGGSGPTLSPAGRRT